MHLWSLADGVWGGICLVWIRVLAVHIRDKASSRTSGISAVDSWMDGDESLDEI